MSSIGPVGPASPVTSADPRAARPAANPGAATGAPAARPGPPVQGEGEATPTPDQVKAAVEAANQQLDRSNRELTFVFDDRLNRMLVKIVDTRTNTVIRQVPSEEMLAAARALSGSSTRGALLRGKA